MTIREWRQLVRDFVGYQDEREVSNATLNRIYRAWLERFHATVRPYRRPAFIAYHVGVPNPPDFAPDFTPGGYILPDNCYIVLNAWFKDLNNSHEWTLIRIIDESKWEFAPKESDLSSGAAAGVVYGLVYERVLYIKGIPDIATHPPNVRIFYSRGPNIPVLDVNGEFTATALDSQIDCPPQYHEGGQYYGIAKVRLLRGDTGDHTLYMGMSDADMSKAQANFSNDGVENALPCIRVDEDLGAYGQDYVAGTRW